MPVKSLDVPDVVANAVLDTILEFTPATVIVPELVGKVSIVVPDTAGDSREIDPDVEPLRISLAKFSLQCF
jgi:hypothetical protein